MKKLNENGSATVLVLVTMLFLITAVGTVYGTVSSKQKSQLEMTKKIQQVYDYQGNLNDIN